jgi:hypothetical protein
MGFKQREKRRKQKAAIRAEPKRARQTGTGGGMVAYARADKDLLCDVRSHAFARRRHGVSPHAASVLVCALREYVRTGLARFHRACSQLASRPTVAPRPTVNPRSEWVRRLPYAFPRRASTMPVVSTQVTRSPNFVRTAGSTGCARHTPRAVCRGLRRPRQLWRAPSAPSSREVAVVSRPVRRIAAPRGPAQPLLRADRALEPVAERRFRVVVSIGSSRGAQGRGGLSCAAPPPASGGRLRGSRTPAEPPGPPRGLK